MLSNSINMVEIIIADGIALLVLFICAFSNMVRMKIKSADGLSLLILIIVLSLCCIFEAFVSLVDGGSGIVPQNDFTRAFNLIGNTITFTGNIIMSCCWSIFVIGHLSGYVKKSRIYVLSGILMAYLIAIIINCFIPYIFSVDSDGIYHREGIGYYINVLLAVALFVIDPLFNYFRIKRSGGLLKFFPIWLFYLPAATGILFQTLFYGISTIYVGLCLGICGILMASQNDMIFRDKLTSLYNRYHLDRLKERLSRKRGKQDFTVMMLDLNGFKRINDNYGHLTGDEALITTANLLREAVGSYGNIIRYAGDEFVIILNIEEEIQIQEKIIHIRETFDAFNEKHLAPYTLSVSIGYSKTNFKDYTIDEIMNDIDKKMYIDKMKQHELHPEWSR